MSSIFTKYPILKNRYIYVSIGFLIWMIFIDDNNVFQQYKSYKELQKMKAKEAYLDEEIQKNKARVENLSSSAYQREKYARERYWMKRDNEDLYIILEDSINTQDTVQY